MSQFVYFLKHSSLQTLFIHYLRSCTKNQREILCQEYERDPPNSQLFMRVGLKMSVALTTHISNYFTKAVTTHHTIVYVVCQQFAMNYCCCLHLYIELTGMELSPFCVRRDFNTEHYNGLWRTVPLYHIVQGFHVWLWQTTTIHFRPL